MTTAKKKPASKPAKKRGGTGPKNVRRALPRRTVVLICCGGVIGVLLLLVLLGAYLIFSPYRDFSAPRLGEPHYLLLRRLATEVRKNRKLKEATIRLTPQEANQLLDIIRHASQFVPAREMPPPKSFMLAYRPDGGVFVSAPVPAAGEWCFGGRIYTSGVLYFEKRENEIFADIPKLRIGRAGLPVPGGPDFLYPAWKEQLKESLPEVFMTAVKCIHSERDGTFVLVYRPAELSRPLKERLSAVEERCSGELKLPLGQLIKSL